MSNLADRKCVPCAEGTPPLPPEQQQKLHAQLDDRWRIVNRHHLEREFRFKDFRQALTFTNTVGELAEAEGHHPDIALSWGKVVVTLWTHKIGGLSENDFVLAAKIDRLL